MHTMYNYTCIKNIMSCIIYTVTNQRAPKIHDYTTSPHHVQSSDQIVLSAVATSTNPIVHATWHHGNMTYSRHITEDPFCKNVIYTITDKITQYFVGC